MGIISHDFYYARQIAVSCAKGSRIFSKWPILYTAGYYNEVKRTHGPPGVCLFIRVGNTVDHLVAHSLPLQLLSVMKI